MIRILVIADDFTGALDTGVQFAEQGFSTKVGTRELLEMSSQDFKEEVLVVDLESRYVSAEEAYKRVKEIVLWAGAKQKVSIIYKKTDSALRGNVGSELAAVVDTTGEHCLYFFPAFPKMRRYTENGIQYFGDIPLAETEFGKDAFEPVKCSSIPDLIKMQSFCNTVVVRSDEKMNGKEGKKIYICDARTDDDIRERMEELDVLGELKVLAGCAGGAKVLAELLRKKSDIQKSCVRPKGIIISCGSLNNITRAQLDYLEVERISRVHLKEEQKSNPDYYDTAKGILFMNGIEDIVRQEKIIIVDTFEKGGNELVFQDVRFNVARCHGIIVKKLIEAELVDTVIITGGDTLMGVVEEIGCADIHPICELQEGVVFSELKFRNRRIQVISKSGGFGNTELLYGVVKKLMNGKGEEDYEEKSDSRNIDVCDGDWNGRMLISG